MGRQLAALLTLLLSQIQHMGSGSNNIETLRPMFENKQQADQ